MISVCMILIYWCAVVWKIHSLILMLWLWLGYFIRMIVISLSVLSTVFITFLVFTSSENYFLQILSLFFIIYIIIYQNNYPQVFWCSFKKTTPGVWEKIINFSSNYPIRIQKGSKFYLKIINIILQSVVYLNFWILKSQQ